MGFGLGTIKPPSLLGNAQRCTQKWLFYYHARISLYYSYGARTPGYILWNLGVQLPQYNYYIIKSIYREIRWLLRNNIASYNNYYNYDESVSYLNYYECSTQILSYAHITMSMT